MKEIIVRWKNVIGLNLMNIKQTQIVKRERNSRHYNRCLLFKRRKRTITGNTESRKNKAFPVYNQRLAGFLMLQGYRLMGVEENSRYQGKNVFYFMESEKIRKCIQSYFGNNR